MLESIKTIIESKRNEDGNVQAGTHLIIIDDSSCQGTISRSNPAILNYYRQFLMKGFDCQNIFKSFFSSKEVTLDSLFYLEN